MNKNMQMTKGLMLHYRDEDNKMAAVGFYGQHDICWSNLNRFVREQKLTQFEVSITWDDFESSQHFFSDFVYDGARAVERKIYTDFLLGNNKEYDLSTYYLGWEGIQVEFFKAQLIRESE